MGNIPNTQRGYDFFTCLSVVQKAIRRNDSRIACYFAIELLLSGFGKALWSRLLTTTAEDCAGIITQEIEALKRSADGKKNLNQGVFVAKAVLILCAQPKTRDADHAILLLHGRQDVTDNEIRTALKDAEGDKLTVPEYAYDVHTAIGRRRGKTKADFIRSEYEALNPKVQGLFDSLIAEAGGGL